eukprot:gene5790-6376_t
MSVFFICCLVLLQVCFTSATSSFYRIDGKGFSDKIGYDVASAGDYNADGYEDFLVSTGSQNKVYVVLGNGLNSLPNVSTLSSDRGFALLGGGKMILSYLSGAGDINHDGYDDFLIGNPDANHSVGMVYVIFGRAGNSFQTVNLTDLGDNLGSLGFIIRGDYSSNGNGYYGNFGSALSKAGDVNGDGVDDFIVGARGFGAGASNTLSGAVYVFFGKSSGSFSNLRVDSSLSASTGIVFYGVAANDALGAAVTGGCDINKDGISDFAFSAPTKDAGLGTIYVIFGQSETSKFAEISLSSGFTDGQGFAIYGERSGVQSANRPGANLHCGMDTNGDGYADIVMGSGGSKGFGYLVFGKNNIDTVYLSSSSSSTSITLSAPLNAYSYHTYSFKLLGDVNGDGYGDVAILGQNGDVASILNKYFITVVFGRAAADWTNIDVTSFPASSTNGFTITGFLSPNNANGVSLDFNNDGYADIVSGAIPGNLRDNVTGSVFLIPGHNGAVSDIVVDYIVPLQHPSMAPTRVPTVVPTKQSPTASPTLMFEVTLLVSSSYTMTVLTSSATGGLSDADILAIRQATATSLGLALRNVKYVNYVVASSGASLRVASSAGHALSESWQAVVVNVEISYPLVDYPSYEGDLEGFYETKKAEIETSVSSGAFLQALLSYGRDVGASAYFGSDGTESNVSSVSTSFTTAPSKSPSHHRYDDGLSNGDVGALVVVPIVGTALLACLAYWVFSSLAAKSSVAQPTA